MSKSPALGMVAQTIQIRLALVSASVAHLSVGSIAITELQAQVLSQGLRQVDAYGIGTIGGWGVLVLVAIKHRVAPLAPTDNKWSRKWNATHWWSCYPNNYP